MADDRERQEASKEAEWEDQRKSRFIASFA